MERREMKIILSYDEIYRVLFINRKKLIVGFFMLFALLSVVYHFYLDHLWKMSELHKNTINIYRDKWWQLITKNLLPKFHFENLIYYSNRCLNTFQGKFQIADDNGYICNRNEVNSNGCCDVKKKKFDCAKCDVEKKCCGEYESCVSCCLGSPDLLFFFAEYNLLYDINYYLDNLLNNNNVNNDNNDINIDNNNIDNNFDNIMAGQIVEKRFAFEICSAICRTSSKSILADEHTFKSPDLKFCYLFNANSLAETEN